jgi:hypothetical protein
MKMIRLLCLAAAALTSLTVGSALAQQPDTVKIGQQTKKAIGTIVAMTDGDTGCYLTLKDDAGGTFKEMADFDICTRRTTLLNKRVSLSYTQQRTMAPECQGNPDCKKSVMVVLVSAAKPIGAAASASRTSFCVAPETVVFECQTGEKTISVCASGDANARRGHLQYRFGIPSNGAAELTLPPAPIVPPKAATGQSVPFSGGGGSWLRFDNGPVSYTVYTGIGKWGPGGAIREKAGLLVARGDKAVASLKCSGKPRSEIGPDWFEKMGIKSAGKDFDFPD